MKIKIYNLDTVLNFGRFRKRTTSEIIKKDPTYIFWCIGHLDHFLISEEVTAAITEKYPIFKFSENLKEIMDKKAETWQNQHYQEHIDRSSYGKYSGTYAQDVEGLSDDFIDDVLDGFPDAYWNID